MKKYQQLVLMIFSLISLTLFLVYRHEYNRLHYILEVFNFFGTPCNFSEFKKSERLLDHYDWGQIPVWQDNDNYYTFSGFLNKSCAQVIALEDKGSRTPKKCFLWYDDNQEPILGQMDSHEFAEDRELRFLMYNCRFRISEHLPYAVSFGPYSSHFQSRKVMLTKLESTSIPIEATICVPPRSFNKRELIEFISFHKLVGIKYFIFYHNDVPNYLTKYLGNLAEILDIEATFLPWNFPKYSKSLIQNIVEKDCMLRTSKKSKSFLLLGINEYLVPLDSYSLYPLFEDSSSHSKYIDVPIQKICITSNDTFRPLAIQNTKIMDDKELRVRKFNFNVSENKTKINNHKFQLFIHSYEYCSNYSGRMLTDKTISRYSTDFSRSTLVQLLIHNQIKEELT